MQERCSSLSGTREATISRRGGTPIGAVLFVTAAELKTLGIDAEQADAVQITIVDGRLQSQSVVATDEDV